MSPIIITNLYDDNLGWSEIPVRHALMASCAAPGYFPAVDFETRSLVDGGLAANAPDLAALTEAIESGKCRLENCKILSVGTASRDPNQVPRAMGKRGLLSWLISDLVPTVLYSQERLVTREAEILLGERFLRIDATPSPDQSAILEMDEAGPKATRTHFLLAQEALKKIPPHKLIDWFD